jgi:hypothetical protein
MGRCSDARITTATVQICRALHTNVTMVARVREKLVAEGLDGVLSRKKRDRPPIEPIFDGKRQAQLIALACSKLPAGRARWTIRLLAEQIVERESDQCSLERQVIAWLRDRNIHNARANWPFTAADARIKLKSLYPAL